jgi:hypothetical protein
MRICVSFLNWVSFGVAVILQSGCATVVNGTHDTINVVTEPSGAVVSTGVTSEETPCALRLSRSRDHKLVISKSGYEVRTVYLHREFSNWAWGDIILVPLVVPLIIDAYSGGIWNIAPESINLPLTPRLQ